MVETVLETWDVALLSDDILVNTVMLTFLVNKSSLKSRKNMRKWWFWAHFILHHRQHWSTCVDQSCVHQRYDASAFKNRVKRVSIIPRSFYNLLQRNSVFSGQSSAEIRPMSTFPVILSTISVGIFFIGIFMVALPLIVRNVFGGGQMEISIMNFCFWGGTIFTSIISLPLA